MHDTTDRRSLAKDVAALLLLALMGYWIVLVLAA